MLVLLVLVVCVAAPWECSAARILAVFPFTAKSHFIMFTALLEELHSRGHHLTVLSHFPRDSSADNYTDISLVGVTKSLNGNMSLSNLSHFGLLDNLLLLDEQIDDYEPIFRIPAVKNLVQSKQSFDLILTEVFNTDLFLGFSHKFKCPNIALSACPLMPWSYSRIGLPIQPSAMPIVFSDRAYPMSVWSMVANTIDWAIALLYYRYFMSRKSERIARQHFGDIPPLEELAAETSLILVNTHFSLHTYMPASNRLIPVGGMHIREAKPLEMELERFLNESEHGVVVFSLGSMFRAESIPKALFDVFLNVFSRLKQNVLWKWESGRPPERKNIKFMKWLPQRDVLAHPNVKLFIYHGGLLGISEAVHCGVPVLGLPQFGDMAQNIAALRGAGRALSLLALTEQTLTDAVNELIYDQRYRVEAERLSKRFRDRPEPPLETAAFWVEYTLRHNGTRHFPRHPSDSSELVILTAIAATVLLLPVFFIFLGLSYLSPGEATKRKMKEV